MIVVLFITTLWCHVCG